jgi:hypothetical protein
MCLGMDKQTMIFGQGGSPMRKVLFLIFLAGFFGSSACIPLWWGETDEGPEPLIQDPAWVEYFEQVKAQPLAFQIPASKNAEAWTRAHDILKNYGRHTNWCPSKLRTSTSNVIEIDVQKTDAKFTFRDVGYLFRIVRVPQEDTVNYTITYAPVADGVVYPNIRAHAQVIAYYIVSGKFMKYVWSGSQFEVRLRH